jgi:hypothetical protein
MILRIKRAILASALLALMAGSGGPARAAIITLDLTSGTYSNQLGTPQPFDTYAESGFRLQVDAAGNHIDLGYLGDFGIHNGPSNPVADNNLVLTFGGAAFTFLGVDIGAFDQGGSLDVIGSNGVTLHLAGTGFQATPGFVGVTSITFSVPFAAPPTNVEGAGFLGFQVDTEVAAAPEPSTWALGAIGALGCGTWARMRRAKIRA